MKTNIAMEFMGFESNAAGRQYTFVVRETSLEPREFTIRIANAAFDDQRIRFQDAPDVCATKLRRELLASANRPVESRFDITDAEIDDYRGTHTLPKPNAFRRRPAEEQY